MMIASFYTLIFLAHIALLAWMIFVLKNAGSMSFNHVMWHFIGLAIFGAGLIVTSALGIKNIQKNQWKKKNQKR